MDKCAVRSVFVFFTVIATLFVIKHIILAVGRIVSLILGG